MEKPRKKIGQILIDAGVIDEMQLKSALGYQSRWGGKLGKILVEMGFLDEDTMIKFLAEHFRIKAVNLLRSRISNKAFEALPKDVARKYNTVPVMVRGEGSKKVMVLAMSDPANLAAIDEISFLTGAKIEPVLATDSAIDIVLKNYGNYDPDKALKQYYQEYASPAELKKQGRQEQTKQEKQKKQQQGAQQKISQASRQLDEELFDFDSQDDLQVVEGDDVVMLKATKPQAQKAQPAQKKQSTREPAPSPQSREVILGKGKETTSKQEKPLQGPSPEESPFLGQESDQQAPEGPMEEPLIEELSEVSEEPPTLEAPVIEAPPVEEKKAETKAPTAPPSAEAPPEMPEMPDLTEAAESEATPGPQPQETAPQVEAPPLPEQEEPSPQQDEVPPFPDDETPHPPAQEEGPPDLEAPPLPSEDSGPPDLEAPPLPTEEDAPPDMEGPPLPEFGKEGEEEKTERAPQAAPEPLDIPDSDENIELADAHEFTPYTQQQQGVDVSSYEEGEAEIESGDQFKFIPPSPDLEAYSDSSELPEGGEEQQVELADAHEFMFMTETPEERGAETENREDEGLPDFSDSASDEGGADDVPTLDDAFISPHEGGASEKLAGDQDAVSESGLPDLGPDSIEETFSGPSMSESGQSGVDLQFETLDSEEESLDLSKGPSFEEHSEAGSDIPPLPDLPDFDGSPGSEKPGPPGPSHESDVQSATFGGDDMPLPELDLDQAGGKSAGNVVSLPFEGPPPDIEEEKAQETGADEAPPPLSGPPQEEPEEDLFEYSQAPPGAEEKIPQDSEDLNDVSLPPLFSESEETEQASSKSDHSASEDNGYDFGDMPSPPDLDSIWASSSSDTSAETWEDFPPSPAEESRDMSESEGPPPLGDRPAEDDDLESLWTQSGPPPPPDEESPPDLDFSGPPEAEEKPAPAPPSDEKKEAPEKAQEEQAGQQKDNSLSALGEFRSVSVLPDETEGLEESLDEISKLDVLGDEFLDTREVKQRLEKISNLENTLDERESNFDELLALMMKKEMGEITQEVFMQELRKLKTRVDDSRKKK